MSGYMGRGRVAQHTACTCVPPVLGAGRALALALGLGGTGILGAGAGLLMSTHLGHGGRRESDLGPPEKPSRPHPRKVRRRTTRIRHAPFRILILGPSAVVDLSKIRAAASRLDEDCPHRVFRITEVRVDAAAWALPPPIPRGVCVRFIVHESLEPPLHSSATRRAAPCPRSSSTTQWHIAAGQSWARTFSSFAILALLFSHLTRSYRCCCCYMHALLLIPPSHLISCVHHPSTAHHASSLSISLPSTLSASRLTRGPK